MVASLPRPVLHTDSIYPDTTNAIAGLFAPDHSKLKALAVSKNKKQHTKKKETDTDAYESDRMLRGTQITSSSVDVSSVYTGVDRVVKYDFTHRDVPEAFEGFRIAFISDLHYKSLLKEKGLNDLVRLLIAQKADVLLMGGDYQEGCEYVEPLFSALARVKTPMGTYGVMGNNDYERCHDDIVNTMKHYGMHPLEHEVDTLRKDGQQIIICRSAQSFRSGAQRSITHFGTLSQGFCHLTGSYAGLHRRRFSSQYRPRSRRTYTRRTSPCIRSRPGTELTLRQSFYHRTGI